MEGSEIFTERSFTNESIELYIYSFIKSNLDDISFDESFLKLESIEVGSYNNISNSLGKLASEGLIERPTEFVNEGSGLSVWDITFNSTPKVGVGSYGFRLSNFTASSGFVVSRYMDEFYNRIT